MRSTKIQDEWPWIVNSDPCCWKMDVPPKAVLSLFFHYLMVPLGMSGRNNRLSKESHHLDVKRSCVPCSMSKIFNLTDTDLSPSRGITHTKRRYIPMAFLRIVTRKRAKAAVTVQSEGSRNSLAICRHSHVPNPLSLSPCFFFQYCFWYGKVRAATRITEAVSDSLQSQKLDTRPKKCHRLPHG
ncbi:hypothetical protein IV203_030383 [Nitzschia inconspicua]|uniref:Uncharacterized protein n=1 Tax=Nitzschia inconspicua TaxID=303405 RepID=A0A9K3LT49_9STRA|nr:hypothetical protein IV203_030383 [Nitzschia inconspicua]